MKNQIGQNRGEHAGSRGTRAERLAEAVGRKGRGSWRPRGFLSFMQARLESAACPSVGVRITLSHARAPLHKLQFLY